MLITHGWGAGRFNALARVPLVAKHARRLVVYDMRGHGESTAKTCTLGVKEPWDVLSILDQVAIPGVDVVLWGVSMGAGLHWSRQRLPSRSTTASLA